MGRRSYDQCCGVARALDIVGERWTLLLVRELLTGPKRFKDLLEALEGIGTNLLAARLKDLEGHGIVRRETLPPPAGSKVYELTELGRLLEPVIVDLCRWGLRFLDTAETEEDLRPSWAMVALRSVLNPEAASETRETYEFRIGGEVFRVLVGDGEVEFGQVFASATPDLIVSGDARTFLEVAAGRLSLAEALDSDMVKVEGDPDARERCMRMVGH